MALPGVWLDSYGTKPPKTDPGGGSGGGEGGQHPPADPMGTPPPPTVAPSTYSGPAGSLTIPGYTPDYSSLIQNDPTYLAWKDNADLSVSNAASARRAALRALVEQYGGLPSGLDTYGDISPDLLGLASANPESQLAQLQRQEGINTEAFKRQLAARGALHSGDLGYGIGQIDQQNADNEYNLGQQFASNFQNAINSYLNAQQNAYSGQYAAIAAAKQNQLANPLNAPTAASSAKLVQGWQSKYGVPVYQGADGKLYVAGPNGTTVPYQGNPNGNSGGARGY